MHNFLLIRKQLRIKKNTCMYNTDIGRSERQTPWYGQTEFLGHTQYEVLINQCIKVARKAYSNHIQVRKITEKIFKAKFGFTRDETIFQEIKDPKKFRATFMKIYEQRILRSFIKLSQWNIRLQRDVMKNQMSLSLFQKDIVKRKKAQGGIKDEQIFEIVNKMKNLQTFVKPLFIQRFSEINPKQFHAKKNQLIVQCYLLLRIQKIIDIELNQRQFSQVTKNLSSNFSSDYKNEKLRKCPVFEQFLTNRTEKSKYQFYEQFPCPMFSIEQQSVFTPLQSSPQEEKPELEMNQIGNYDFSSSLNLDEQQ